MKEDSNFPLVIKRGCGLDVHKQKIVATIRGENIQQETLTFQSYTTDLEKLVEWLLIHGIERCSHGEYRCLLEACI